MKDKITHNNDKAAAALEYADLGWAVLPLHNVRCGICSCGRKGCGGKHPRTKNGFKDATTDCDVIEAWWKHWPDADVGIATGRISGIVVIDIDYRHDGKASLENLCKSHESLPITPRVMTGGGEHIYLQFPSDQEIRSTQRLSGYSGIDIKADGGYVVAPPSSHISGKVYQWAPSLEYDNEEIAPIPQWLIEHLTSPRKNEKISTATQNESPANRNISKTLVGLQAGNRNSSFTSIAGKLWRAGVYADDIVSLLEPHANAVNFPIAELSQLVNGLCRRYPDQPEQSRSVTENSSISFADIKEPPEQRFLLEGFIPVNHTSLLYADGGQGKSYTVLSIAFHLATGRPFAGLKTEKTRVLYADWELNRDDHARRAHRLARGMDLGKPPADTRYIKLHEPIHQVLGQLIHEITMHEIGFVIIDSLGLAAGVDPESAQQIIPLFAALRELQTTVLLVDHQSKLQDGQRYSKKDVFGSVYKRNLSRSMFQLKLADRSESTMELLMRIKKENFGARYDQHIIRFQFHGEKTTVTRGEINDRIAEHMSAAQQIIHSLKEGGGMTKTEIAAECDLNRGTVANELSRLKRSGKICEQGKRGNAPIYVINNTNRKNPEGR